MKIYHIIKTIKIKTLKVNVNRNVIAQVMIISGLMIKNVIIVIFLSGKQIYFRGLVRGVIRSTKMVVVVVVAAINQHYPFHPSNKSNHF